jgi:hypothetical protein
MTTDFKILSPKILTFLHISREMFLTTDQKGAQHDREENQFNDHRAVEDGTPSPKLACPQDSSSRVDHLHDYQRANDPGRGAAGEDCQGATDAVRADFQLTHSPHKGGPL